MIGRFYRTQTEAIEAVLKFWFEEAGPGRWFSKNSTFDEEIARRFGPLYEEAAAGRLDVWRAHADSALALIIMLDQFSRNLLRGRTEAFACDDKAVALAEGAIRRRFDMITPKKRRPFFYMPFMHSEQLAVQERSVQLFKARLPGSSNLPFAQEHRDIIARFGRFPHRNSVLRRVMRPEEAAYLAAGGFSF
ncbi:MAG: DUF924 family protein [Parvularculaceae bacterium]